MKETLMISIVLLSYSNVLSQDTIFYLEKSKKAFYVPNYNERNGFSLKIFCDTNGNNILKNSSTIISYSYYNKSFECFQNFKFKGYDIIESFVTELKTPKLDTVYKFIKNSAIANPKHIKKFEKYVSLEVIYPVEALRQKIGGRVLFMVIVDTNGHIVNNTLISKKIGYGLEEEAERLLKNYKNFGQIFHNGKSVNKYIGIPIVFKP